MENNKKYVLKFDTTGSLEKIEINSNSIHDTIKKDLGCSYEIVYPKGLGNEYFMLVDSNGVQKELDINIFGSYLYGSLEHGIPIVGPIYILKNKSGDFEGLSDESILEFQKQFNELNSLIQNIK